MSTRCSIDTLRRRRGRYVAADWTWDVGLSLRTVQTGSLRQYVMFIVVGTVVLCSCRQRLLEIACRIVTRCTQMNTA